MVNRFRRVRLTVPFPGFHCKKAQSAAKLCTLQVNRLRRFFRCFFGGWKSAASRYLTHPELDLSGIFFVESSFASKEGDIYHNLTVSTRHSRRIQQPLYSPYTAAALLSVYYSYLHVAKFDPSQLTYEIRKQLPKPHDQASF